MSSVGKDKNRSLPEIGDAEQINMLIEATTAFTEQIVLSNEIQAKQNEIVRDVLEKVISLESFNKDKDGLINVIKDSLDEHRLKVQDRIIDKIKSQANKIIIYFISSTAIFGFIVYLIIALVNNGGK